MLCDVPSLELASALAEIEPSSRCRLSALAVMDVVHGKDLKGGTFLKSVNIGENTSFRK
jgi:hypothetical protein